MPNNQPTQYDARTMRYKSRATGWQSRVSLTVMEPDCQEWRYKGFTSERATIDFAQAVYGSRLHWMKFRAYGEVHHSRVHQHSASVADLDAAIAKARARVQAQLAEQGCKPKFLVTSIELEDTKEPALRSFTARHSRKDLEFYRIEVQDRTGEAIYIRGRTTLVLFFGDYLTSADLDGATVNEGVDWWVNDPKKWHLHN